MFTFYVAVSFIFLTALAIYRCRGWLRYLNLIYFVYLLYASYGIYQDMHTPHYLLNKAARIENKQAFIQELYRLKTKIPHKEFIERLALWREHGVQIPNELFE